MPVERSKSRPLLYFFRKVSLLILFVYVFWFGYVELMPDFYNEPNNTRWVFLTESLDNKHFVPEVSLLFLGDSRTNAGIDFNRFTNAWSFAAGGATNIESYYALTKFLEKHPKPDTVFISVSPRFMSETFAFYPYAVRNNFFTWEDIHEINSLYTKNETDTTLGDALLFNYLLHKVRWVEYYQGDISRNYGIRAYSANKAMIADMQKRRGGRDHPGLRNSCSDLNYETNYKKFSPSPILSEYLQKTLKLCTDSSIVLICEAMPMNQSSVKNLHPEFVSQYQLYMQDLQKKFPNVLIIDSLSAYPDSCFGDDSHLNSRGRAQFTSKLISRLIHKSYDKLSL